MFDYGFSQWPSILLASAGRDFRTLPVTGSLVRFVPVQVERDVRYPLAADERVTAKIDLPDQVEAPVEEGDIAGSLTYYVDGTRMDRWVYSTPTAPRQIVTDFAALRSQEKSTL